MELNSKPIIDDLYLFVDMYTKHYEKVKNKLLDLTILMVGNDPGSESYVNMKQKACMDHNIKPSVYNYDNHIANLSSMLSDSIKYSQENNIPTMVQLPIPGISKSEQTKILNGLNYLIDVDGLNENTFNIDFDIADKDNRKSKLHSKRIKPCTSAGIRMLLKYNNIDVTDMNVLVVGRSKLLGKPLANLLIEDNANVSIAHSKTSEENLKRMALQSDIIISTTGQANLITPDMIKDGVILIDTGFNRIDGKIVGDIHEDCWKKASLYNKYTNCIGPLTIAILLFNTCVYTYASTGIGNDDIDCELSKLVEKYNL